MPKPCRPLIERLMQRVSPEPMSGCWLWTGHVCRKGYARISSHYGEALSAHRVSYELFVGPIPEGMQLDHLCRVRSCVNPKHLEPVTNRENQLRGIMPKRFAARTHCKYGHELNDVNVHRRGTLRICIPCRNIRSRQCYERKRNKIRGQLTDCG